ncbi:PAS domain-containing protein [Rhodocytophaga rosea]|uniref:histidine kinase n=1 Tax=Rhodocytophaga rosea TaxID=2704465 RepID=A0A6C0GRV5_9BACT|nr:PAS domain-containing sensor histidine kinase [Rhodocytophaga rosea]QHT70799.1 PAS domain-containing protein [Rhodocytophaga rosea]
MMRAEKSSFSNREAQQIIQYLPDPCLLLSVEGYILAASQAFYLITDTDEKILGEFLFDVFPENPDSPQVNAVSSLQYSFMEAVCSKQPHHIPLQQYDIPKGGKPSDGFIRKFWRAVNVPVLDEQGQVKYILHRTEDVTEQINDKKQIKDLTALTEELLMQEQLARQEAERQREYVFNLLMQTPVAIAIYEGSNFVVRFANEKLLEFAGRSREQILDRSLFEAIPEIAQHGFEVALKKVYTSGESLVQFDVSVRLTRHQTPEQAYFHIIYNPFRNLQGEIVGVIVACTEITGQVEAKEKLVQIMQDLKERNFELDQFVYKTSHDLRAPLMTILGLVRLIKGEPLPDSVSQYVDLIENRVNKLDGFIKSTLDYSRNTRTDVEYEKIDLNGLVKETFAALELMKNFERLAISLHIADGDFYSDLFRLRIIFSNLISNAVKYMDTSKAENCLNITIKVDDKLAKIHLYDNGMGIEKAYQDHIFGMFFRATEQSEGSGLGLYIVRQAVMALKGTITFRSKPGKGTHFLVILPNRMVN